jgi:predicted transcriptional regulator of viral defense system
VIASTDPQRMPGAIREAVALNSLRNSVAVGGVYFPCDPVRKGVWALAEEPDPLAVAEYVTAPYPSYLSLQTALYRHGMIDQIPSMIFVVSLARTGRIETPLGTYSVHHVQPSFFDGFEPVAESGIKLATPEKALVDCLYLSPTRGRLFSSLPELELPRGFRRSEALRWVRRVPSPRLRTLVERKLDEVLARSPRPR